MKKHAIIPVFIPHLGCPNDCVFCNQRKITARTAAPTCDEVRETIEEWLTTLEPNHVRNGGSLEEIEVSFYGGSFTGLPIEEQSKYLAIAGAYMEAGRIDGIHLSTRPDYIDRERMDILAAYGVGTVEIGVQSFDDVVLKASNRGHDSAAVYRASELIREYGMKLGIQLMIGLPGDSMESCVYSARKTAEIKPELARLYPTIVLDDTGLYEMYESGDYKALSREEAVERTLAMYKILYEAGVYIMRVGLKSTDIIGDGGAINGGTYHPAFRQLVEGRWMREKTEPRIEALVGEYKAASSDAAADDICEYCAWDGKPIIYIYSNDSWYSNIIGNRAENRKYFSEKYPEFRFKFRTDESLEDAEVRVTFTG